MFTARNYVKVSSLNEAWQLNQRRSCRIVGGMQWMKMGNGDFNTIIDLSGLGMDKIEESREGWKIGSMVTLRRMEQCSSLEEYTDGALKEALRHIVGVQFRNMATIGGTTAGRFGFSDPLTLLSVMDTSVELYHRGIVSLKEFIASPRDNDIVSSIIIRKEPAPIRFAYNSMRLTERWSQCASCCRRPSRHCPDI